MRLPCVCVCVLLSLSCHTLCDGIKRRSITFIVVFLVFWGGRGLHGGADERAQHAGAGVKAVLLHREVVPGRFLVEDMDNLSFQVCSCWICCPDSGTHSSVVSSLRGSLTSDLAVCLQGDGGQAPQHPV